jgi:phospholipase/carboxylesterase
VPLGCGSTGRPGYSWNQDSAADEYLLAAMAHACREFHVHTERVYLIGLGEGARAAYRLGLALADQVAGVVALNGRFLKSGRRPLVRLNAVRKLRIYIGHGASNPVVPIAAARQTMRDFNAAGADVRFQAYPTTHRIHPDMLRDVNRWIMDAVSDADELPPLP